MTGAADDAPTAESGGPPAAPAPAAPSCGAKTKAFVIKHYLPLGFCLALTIGLAFPQPGAWLSSITIGDYKVVQSACIVAIFIISGLTLRTSEVKAAIQAWLSYSYGVIAILFITPFFGLVILQIPLQEPALTIGFAVFCCVPTTLTSGVTLATQAGGNGALALMLTVTTNVVGVFTTPLMLSLMLSLSGMDTAATGDITFDTGALILKLILTILLPTLVGKVIRESHKAVPAWVTNHKVALSLTNNSLLIIIVWMTISSGRDQILSQGLTLLLVVGIGIALHVAFLAFNAVAVWALALPKAERKAVHILASQKTLPVAVTVLSFLPPSLGDAGLLTIPCIIGHLSQLFIDAFLVSSGSFERPFLLAGKPTPDDQLPPPCCCWRRRHTAAASSEAPMLTLEDSGDHQHRPLGGEEDKKEEEGEEEGGQAGQEELPAATNSV
eukprot:CAMPEP_0117687150 /NCGR_PEP_ID=MMETSP0804-20121206/22956_1 /TAXON_ID=1074897 /ORGANISM="Tetraselmis astigmatica, Strain CCMP880" /LENGTH=440 /DNA_ID=CAMNT_0005499143 /DNA_START=94 /DNA_END=1416 /DNA_ORIENTATION=-